MHHHYHITESNFCVFTIISEFYTTFLYFYHVNWCPFTFTQRASFRISYKAGLLVMNSPSFCLFREVFILPSFLKDSFTGYIIFGGHFFFQYSEYVISFYPNLKHFCWEIHWSSYGFSLICSLLFLAALRIPSLSLSFDNLIIMWLVKYYLGSTYLGLNILAFCFLFFWNPHNANVICFHCIPKIFNLSLLFFILFFFFSSDWIISNVLPFRSLILSSAWSSMFLKLSTEFCS